MTTYLTLIHAFHDL